MEKIVFKSFMEKLVAYHFALKTNPDVKTEFNTQDIDSLTEALQFVERLETDSVPYNFSYAATGELVLKWNNPESENENSRIFQLAFHKNKDVSCSKYKLGEDTITKTFPFQNNADYYKTLKELEVDMLNFLDGDIGTQAFLKV